MTQAYSDPEDTLPDIETFYNDEAPAAGWYWWSCFPGCWRRSDPVGPFDTEAEALAHAQDWDRVLD